MYTADILHANLLQITAEYVELCHRPRYYTDVPLDSVQFLGEVHMSLVPTNSQGPMFAVYVAFANIGDRVYDVETYVLIQALDDIQRITPEDLTRQFWRQERDFLGWWWEIKHLFFRWRRHHGKDVWNKHR